MRRAFLHIGFHKTGTTSAQRFLWRNRKLIWPGFALALPNRLRDNYVAGEANFYARNPSAAALNDYGARLTRFLEQLEFGTGRGLIVSEEELGGARASNARGNHYRPLPALAKTLCSAVTTRFAPEPVEITLYFSTRAAEQWLQSLWAHELRKTRCTLSLEAFAERYQTAADFTAIIEQVREDLPGVVVETRRLEELANQPYGPAQPFVDFIQSMREKVLPFETTKPVNQSPNPETLETLLALHRSGLSDEAWRDAVDKTLQTAGMTRQKGGLE